MLSDKTNILQLVALLKAHGIVDIVLCPGSRNAPIVHTFSQLSNPPSPTNKDQLSNPPSATTNDEYNPNPFRCHALTDERSAGFFAIGLALATSRTVAVCVTSGSALLNLHPAASEALYQQVPIVIISADRPAAWIGQMDGQTLPQPEALGSMVKMSVQLTENDAWHNNRLINEALLECTHRTRGPVHINVPITEPFYEFHTPQLPEERVIHRIEGLYPQQLRDIASLLSDSHRRLIIIGQKPADRQINPALMSELNRGYVSLCEHLANCGEGSVALNLTDALMTIVEAADANKHPSTPSTDDDFCPDLVITVCGHIINKRLKQWLRRHPPRQHWHVSPDGSVADLFGCLTTIIEAQPYQFLQALAYITIPIEEENTFPQRWADAALQARKTTAANNEATDSKATDSKATDSKATDNTTTDSLEARAVRHLLTHIPDNAVLHLANSSSVRLAQNTPLPKGVTVCCNRGVNGIEGSLSSAVGYATATPHRPNYVITGDLSFFYDRNALWNTHLPANLHILLLNNGGGAIFNTLPLPDDQRSKHYIMARHHTSARLTALQHGLRYLAYPAPPSGTSTLDSILNEFIHSEQSILCEIENRQ